MQFAPLADLIACQVDEVLVTTQPGSPRLSWLRAGHTPGATGGTTPRMTRAPKHLCLGTFPVVPKTPVSKLLRDEPDETWLWHRVQGHRFHKYKPRLSIPSDRQCMIFYLAYCCCCLVTKLCPTLCDPMVCSTPGFPVLHRILEFAQTHVHWIGDAI